MIVLCAYQTELDLNNVQKTACAKHTGAARFSYNWGLSRKLEAFQAGEKTPTAIDLHRELNALKQTEFAWMYAVSKCAPQEALRNLDQAFAHFSQRVKEKQAGKKVQVGFPKFKSQKNGLGSFRLTGAIHIFEDALQLPHLGRLRLKERGYLPVSGVHLLSATVSERAGRWFVSVQVELEIPVPQVTGKPVVGVDLGMVRLGTVSDGTVIENPHALKHALGKIKRFPRTVSRRQKGSANRGEALARLAKAHLRVTHLRKDTLHQATRLLAKTKSAGGLEDLNVSGMLRNHHLAQAIADVGMYEFRRQLTDKGKWFGCQVLLADRYYPSTKRCSHCGNVKPELDLGQRSYAGDVCGGVMERDLNAAVNLEQWWFGMALPQVLREVTPVERG
jgi:putative transposase